MKGKDINIEILNALKCKRREEEIRDFGKQISFRPLITKNKKKYTRKIKHKSVSDL